MFRIEGIYCSVESVQERWNILFSRICSEEKDILFSRICSGEMNILFSRICSEEKEYIVQ